MIESSSVFDAVRRGCNELESASNSEIQAYFADVDADAMAGHISNIKGIVFEQEVTAALNEQGLDAMMFEATNHPVSDISIMSDGDIAAEVQLKATDSISYINDTLESHADVPIIATSEVAQKIDSELVFDSGMANAALEQAVADTLSGELAAESAAGIASGSVSEGLAETVGESLLPIPITPIGLIGALLGLPFL